MKRLLASKLSIPVLAAEETKLEQVRGFALSLLCPPVVTPIVLPPRLLSGCG